MKVGIAADHSGFSLKADLEAALLDAGYEVRDFEAREFYDGDDYPDFVVPLARDVAGSKVERRVRCAAAGWGRASRPTM